MNRNRCFLDFDGTINDYSDRMYEFFKDNVPAELNNVLRKDEFWNLKRMGIHEAKWINEKFEANIDITEWDRKKIELIETEKYLAYDKLFPFSRQGLIQLKERYEIILITKRSSEQNLLLQIRSYRISEFFRDIIVIPHSKKTKEFAVTERYKTSSNDIFVGDTEDDIKAGLSLRIHTYFVLSGIRELWITKKKFNSGRNNFDLNKLLVFNNILEIAELQCS